MGSGGGEFEGFVVAAGEEAEGFDDEVVVVALGEAGDGDGADDAGAGDVDGETAAVGGVVLFGEVVALGEGEAGLLEEAADVIGAFVEAGDDVDLAADPAGVVGGGAGEGAVEELLVGGAEAADIDNDVQVAGDGEFAEERAELPGGLGGEGLEGEGGFLQLDGGEIFGDGHGATGYLTGFWG